ncbi:ABC transporter permease [Microbacterium protaetiae]|uniref:ABC transporter permease n=1 Tax=Microbacterium protaetiae TaxID=2509458 RepID=A0A4P6ECT2_9MICO|nr:ABC transporter permease [Microbacterium protaetiae]QAY59163.1 ABC transporter permease [Microbacterium protaetiae]
MKLLRHTAAAVAFGLGLPVLLILIWWAASLNSTSIFVPRPGDLVTTFFRVWGSDRFLTDVLPSLGRYAIGAILAVVLGVIIGVVVGLNQTLRALTEPVFEFFRALPPPVLMPILMFLIGVGDAMKITIIVLGAVWPVLLNTIEGVRSTDSVQNETSRSYGIVGVRRVWYQVIPSAAPQILAGVRQSLPIALILMVISEMMASSSGLGFSIIQFQRRFEIPEMWAGIVLLGLIGLVVSLLFKVLEGRILRWYYGLKDLDNAA